MITYFNKYLNKSSLTSPLFTDYPSKDLGNIVIIPAYCEPNIFNTLNNLIKCSKPNLDTEIIILVNESEDCSYEVSKLNKNTFNKIKAYCLKYSTKKISFKAAYINDLPKKHAGAGIARKILMDEAIRRFSVIDNALGVIFSLDADTLVSENYLEQTSNIFNKKKKLNAVTFYFEHRLNVKKYGTDATNAIILYELHLRYFRQALKLTTFPYAFHTIGSCFAVKANTYVMQGGMNKKKAGEDFYFLQKIFPLGNCIEEKSIKVFPSARPSNRVPFGTGPAINKIINDGDFLTYQLESFLHLKKLFKATKQIYEADKDLLNIIYSNLHNSLKSFISFNEFFKNITEIKNNSASFNSFEKRFFNWFNAFKVIKYLNATHNTYYKKISIVKAASQYITKQNMPIYTNDAKILLRNFQAIEIS